MLKENTVNCLKNILKLDFLKNLLKSQSILFFNISFYFYLNNYKKLFINREWFLKNLDNPYPR